MSKKTKTPKPNKRILINVKVMRNQKSAIESKAKIYTKGNVSKWVRQAAMNYSPR